MNPTSSPRTVAASQPGGHNEAALEVPVEACLDLFVVALGPVAGYRLVDVLVGVGVHDVLVGEETFLVVLIQADTGKLEGVAGQVRAVPHPEDSTLGAII